MRPADRGQLRSDWLSSGRFGQLRSAETSSVGSKIGTRFASVLTTRLPTKTTISRPTSWVIMRRCRRPRGGDPAARLWQRSELAQHSEGVEADPAFAEHAV